MNKHWYRLIVPLVGVLMAMAGLSGCGSAAPTVPPPTATLVPISENEVGADNVAKDEEATMAIEATASGEPIFFGFTYQQADGNRLVSGQINAPLAQPLDIPLAGQPVWLVAVPNPGNEGSVWAAVLTDGQVQAFAVTNGDFEEIGLNVSQLPPGMPPLLYSDGARPLLVEPPAAASPTTHPVLLPAGQIAFIDTDGDLVFLENGAETARLPLNALPDARILVDEQARLLLLTSPTGRYAHAVLGDSLEAASITLIETDPTPTVALTIPISEPAVIEGLAPIWTDLSGDGQREIIVTVSDPEQGAQLVVFNEAGEQMAAGPAIGQGNRWRHQIAVAPSGPDGELELIDVHTPHLGRVTEFFRLTDDALDLVAQSQENYTSHFLGSRNLDMAVAGDFDRDGRVEVLLPNADASALGAIRRTATGAEVVWVLGLRGEMSTNLATTPHGPNGFAIGVGLTDNLLRVWWP